MANDKKVDLGILLANILLLVIPIIVGSFFGKFYIMMHTTIIQGPILTLAFVLCLGDLLMIKYQSKSYKISRRPRLYKCGKSISLLFSVVCLAGSTILLLVNYGVTIFGAALEEKYLLIYSMGSLATLLGGILVNLMIILFYKQYEF